MGLTRARAIQTSMPLYELLHQNNLVTTHSMIGVNIIDNPTEFQYAFETLQSACHRVSRGPS